MIKTSISQPNKNWPKNFKYYLRYYSSVMMLMLVMDSEDGLESCCIAVLKESRLKEGLIIKRKKEAKTNPVSNPSKLSDVWYCSKPYMFTRRSKWFHSDHGSYIIFHTKLQTIGCFRLNLNFFKVMSVINGSWWIWAGVD